MGAWIFLARILLEPNLPQNFIHIGREEFSAGWYATKSTTSFSRDFWKEKKPPAGR